MRPLILISMFALSGYIANAQFSILPQAGVEIFRTPIELNAHSFSPSGAKTSPQASIRLDYKFKQSHGPYLGIATSRTVTKFNFTDPETAMNSHTASKGNTQFRLEGGYQLRTRPIYFKRTASTNKSLKSSQASSQKISVKRSCGSYFVQSSCFSKKSKINNTSPAILKDKGSWVRIQPSAGVAYLPSVSHSEIFTKNQGTQTSYEYNAGNWKTALMTGLGFEFGKNDKSKFLLSINYLKGISNLDTKSVTTVSGNKSTTPTLKSEASAWSLRIGIPVSLKKQIVKQQVIEKTHKEEKRCGQYKGQCNKNEFRPRCMRAF